MEFITVKEAIELTGKSEKTIRKFINETDQAYVKRTGATGRSYLIDKEHLLENYQVSSGTTSKASANADIIQILKEEIKFLKEELEKKNKQLDKTNEQLDKANDISREALINLRINQITTLSDGDKKEIIQALGRKVEDE